MLKPARKLAVPVAKIVFFSPKSVGKYMSGPAIRVWELAKVLSQKHAVSIISPKRSDLASEKVQIIQLSFIQQLSAILKSDILVVPVFFIQLHWLLLAFLLRKNIVIDAYCPFYIENQEKFSRSIKKSSFRAKIDSVRLKIILRLGDLYLCASERQKKLWEEWLASLHRVASALIRVLPTGLRTEQPILSRGIKGVIPGIARDDFVVLWSSGIWPWFDALSAIRAINQINDPRIKLVFYGIDPVEENFQNEFESPVKKAVDLAKELGLYEKKVFFIKERVPYDKLGEYLLGADIALNLHHKNLETYYAFRTRVLDYIWARLPVITTCGDVLSEEIQNNAMGIVVDYENDEQIAKAVLRLKEDRVFYQECKQNMQMWSRNREWKHVAKPLEEYCAGPFRVQDKPMLLGFFMFFKIIGLYFLVACFILRYSWFSKLFVQKEAA